LIRCIHWHKPENDDSDPDNQTLNALAFSLGDFVVVRGKLQCASLHSNEANSPLKTLNIRSITMAWGVIEQYWTEFVNWWPYGDGLLVIFILVVAHELAWIPLNAFFFALHHFHIPFFDQWKIQKARYPSGRLLRDCIKASIINHVIVAPIFGYLVVWPLFSFLQMPIRTSFPTFLEVVVHCLICLVLNDFFFYWSHRWLHSSPWVYKKFHAQHHRFITPIAIASEYASPLESIISNSFPTLVGCFILRSHLFTIGVWLFFRVVETMDAHCGYEFPFSPFRLLGWCMLGTEGHDWHHSHNRGNYGMLIFWDSLCGTDREFRTWRKDKSADKGIAEEPKIE